MSPVSLDINRKEKRKWFVKDTLFFLDAVMAKRSSSQTTESNKRTKALADKFQLEKRVQYGIVPEEVNLEKYAWNFFAQCENVGILNSKLPVVCKPGLYEQVLPREWTDVYAKEAKNDPNFNFNDFIVVTGTGCFDLTLDDARLGTNIPSFEHDLITIVQSLEDGGTPNALSAHTECPELGCYVDVKRDGSVDFEFVLKWKSDDVSSLFFDLDLVEDDDDYCYKANIEQLPFVVSNFEDVLECVLAKFPQDDNQHSESQASVVCHGGGETDVAKQQLVV